MSQFFITLTAGVLREISDRLFPPWSCAECGLPNDIKFGGEKCFNCGGTVKYDPKSAKTPRVVLVRPTEKKATSNKNLN